LNYSESQSGRITRIAAYDRMSPATVPTTALEGKLLFEQSGCYACHYRGAPDNPRNGHGGYAGPNLSFEGARHSQLWEQMHYLDPQAFVPKSIMPVFPFSDTERQALSAYNMTALPRGGHPVSEKQDVPPDRLQALKVMTPEYRYMTR
jgi:cbb3-type cytochrome oxidase cytochrome c subunit